MSSAGRPACSKTLRRQMRSNPIRAAVAAHIIHIVGSGKARRNYGAAAVYDSAHRRCRMEIPVQMPDRLELTVEFMTSLETKVPFVGRG